MSHLRAYLNRMCANQSGFEIAGMVGIYIASIPILIILSLGMPTGLGVSFDILIISMIGLFLLLIMNIVISALITLIKYQLPRLLLGAILSAFTGISLALWTSSIAYWGATILTIIVIGIGFMVSTSMYYTIIRLSRRILHISYVILSISLFIFVVLWIYNGTPSHNHYQTSDLLSQNPAHSLLANNPSEKGTYEYRTLTYGGGADRHRKEFGNQVDIRTSSVDASAYIQHWSLIRKLFWGFDQSALPLNGRAWLPIGEGPFPLVLIVHGNHLMENFSDDGYAYLGELLASQGYLTISIDENFINYSIWSGGLKRDMEVRSWLLLQHVEAIRKLNEQTNNPLYTKVDMNHIALIGHSRGGQAAVLAAQSPEIHSDIQAVIAIAPTDRVVDDKYLQLEGVPYLTIQGSQDADVSTFTGDRQYERVALTSRDYVFKSSIYIARANHSQFNTSWGFMDLSLPTGLLLNSRDIMKGSEQRLIAQTYVAAFLDVAIKNNQTFLPMFKDYRSASDWLPNTIYRSRFKDSSFNRIVDYEEDHTLETMSIPNGRIEAWNMKDWQELSVVDRQGSSKHNRSAQLSWSEKTGIYELTLPSSKHNFISKLTENSELSFSIANLTDEPHIQLTIELEALDGSKVQIPIQQIQHIYAPIHTQFTKEPFLDKAVRKGRYGASTEPVFQTYFVPLHSFLQSDPHFLFHKLKFIRFIFANKRSGSILLDDIGFY